MKKRWKNYSYSSYCYFNSSTCFIIMYYFSSNDKEKTIQKENKVSTLNETNTVKNEVETPTGGDSEDIEIVPTMEDEVVADTAWCPTFQLVWNDMKMN